MLNNSRRCTYFYDDNSNAVIKRFEDLKIKGPAVCKSGEITIFLDRAINNFAMKL